MYSEIPITQACFLLGLIEISLVGLSTNSFFIIINDILLLHVSSHREKVNLKVIFVFILNKPWILPTQGCFVLSFVKIDALDLQENIYLKSTIFCLPIGKVVVFYFNILEFNVHCQVRLDLAQWFCGNVFHCFANCLLLEKDVFIVWMNLKRMLWGKFGWNLSAGSWEEVENVKR